MLSSIAKPLGCCRARPQQDTATSRVVGDIVMRSQFGLMRFSEAVEVSNPGHCCVQKRPTSAAHAYHNGFSVGSTAPASTRQGTVHAPTGGQHLITIDMESHDQQAQNRPMFLNFHRRPFSLSRHEDSAHVLPRGVNDSGLPMGWRATWMGLPANRVRKRIGSMGVKRPEVGIRERMRHSTRGTAGSRRCIRSRKSLRPKRDYRGGALGKISSDPSPGGCEYIWERCPEGGITRDGGRPSRPLQHSHISRDDRGGSL
ncbi:hypothetical protein LZ31DRAFT_342048 [Colletotrichum somersetense]|nr:hypothetical protein LZ31DRAFT_342048 [Colletotrichum somersetense]